METKGTCQLPFGFRPTLFGSDREPTAAIAPGEIQIGKVTTSRLSRTLVRVTLNRLSKCPQRGGLFPTSPQPNGEQ